MISFKSIQTSYTFTRHNSSFHRKKLSNSKKYSIICLSKSNDSDSDSDSKSGASSPQGDTRKQDLLARIAQLQAQKVRLTDFLDERSEYLTQFAEEANTEFDKIGEDALKGLEEASDRIMENINSRMQAFEESAELKRQEIEKNENKVEAFKGEMEKDRNEGLFFKNLREGTPKQKAEGETKEEIEKIKKVTKESAGSKNRRNIYLVLIGLLVIGITDSFISSTADWRKVAALGAILVGLVSQFIYEQQLLSENEETEEDKTEEENK